MLKITKSFTVLGLAILILLAGCGLVSITILLDQEIDQTTVPTNFYYYAVDVTDEPDWEDHKDQIEAVNYVTFDLYLSNPQESAVTVDGYIDDADNTVCSAPTCAVLTTRILKNITIPAGSQRHITAGQSLAFMENMETLKDLAETGMFHFYGVTTGDSPGTFVIDSGRVVVAIVVSGP